MVIGVIDEVLTVVGGSESSPLTLFFLLVDSLREDSEHSRQCRQCREQAGEGEGVEAPQERARGRGQVDCDNVVSLHSRGVLTCKEWCVCCWLCCQ